MLCIGVNKIKIHFDTSQLCCGVVHSLQSPHIFSIFPPPLNVSLAQSTQSVYHKLVIISE